MSGIPTGLPPRGASRMLLDAQRCVTSLFAMAHRCCGVEGVLPGSSSGCESRRHVVSNQWMIRGGDRLRSFAVLALYSVVLLFAGKWLGGWQRQRGTTVPLPRRGMDDHGPIDAVYTWVNGSDEAWLRDMMQWKRRLGLDTSTENLTEVSTANRFRENDELRYSVRSLSMHAPWIRHIFIVTNGQVPAWLNVSHPGVSVITHAQIFPNHGDLPTFSSNAIEANLHRIPGLSRRWIYFNDDVFLVQPVFPSDWVILSSQDRTTYKVYLTWPIPTCAEGCMDSWIGDGTCDVSCNVTACSFDGGDCHGVSGLASSMDWMEECSGDCLHGLIGNRQCDDECDSEQCAFDGGECLEDPSTGDRLYGIVLEPPVTKAEPKSNISAVMTVDNDMSSMFVDVASLVSGPITAVEVNSSFVLLHNILESLPTRVFLILSQPRLSSSVQLRIHTSSHASPSEHSGDAEPHVVTVELVEEPQEFEEYVGEEDDMEERAGDKWRQGTLFADEEEYDEEEEDEGEWEEQRRLLMGFLHGEAEGNGTGSRLGRRLLMDTFGNELRFVDRLLRERFGYRRRRVPAHMPHMIESQIMAEIQGIWSAEYAATSRQRFRTGEDIQMAFAYFSYLIEAKNVFTVRDVVGLADGNGDGLISREELHWIALRASKHGSRRPSRESALGLIWPILERHSHELAAGRPGISFPKVLKHTPLVEALNASASQQSEQPKYHTVEADERLSRFIMLRNNITDSILELDNARVDQHSYLFLCLNDNLDEAAGDILPVLQEVRALLAHLFPTPSPYELPNSGGYVGAYQPSGLLTPDVCGVWCTRTLIAANCAFLVWLVWLSLAKPPKRRPVRRRILSSVLY